MAALPHRTGSSWGAAPKLVKLFPVAPILGFATEYSFNLSVRASPGAFVVAVLIVAILTVQVIRRRVWAWILLVLVLVLNGLFAVGVIHRRHPIHTPLALEVVVALLNVMLLLSPAMLRWAGVLRLWSSDVKQGA